MIRRATLSDVNQIANVIMRAWKEGYSGIIDPEYIKTMETDKYVSIFKDNISNQKEIIFVYDEKGVKGFISGKELKGKCDCEVVGLYVDPENQGKGMGKLLFKKMEEEFLKRGKSRLIVWTLHKASNNGFYLKMGGLKKEDKTLNYGGKSYAGVGFVFDLK
ncbi:MAG: GNAT family N-acetyltransferase [Euryarchaeota archaeon]|uniref:GNAT family N-acetyltransferase n=1 Tax=Methanobacterium sp. MZD130B TaxID=3394378 RepID=UPI001758E316|nr:GNAT family N-acetyltransferase [Euryarchaeota archaeon]HHT18301.1 GNAT family N-acetyltransferase [Methanobacterium sp.]